jgi:hypothetical protein
MRAEFYPLQVLLAGLAGWLNRHQQKGKRLRLTDDQRRQLAAKAKRLGRKALDRIATIATPDTLRSSGPTRRRGRSGPSSWRSFLKAHWGQIAGADFFTTELRTPCGLRRYFVLFLIELETRRVHVAGSPRIRTAPSWRRSPATSRTPSTGSSTAAGS